MEKNITYMRRFNLGNYEHEEITIVDTVSEGTAITDKIAELQKTCIENSLSYKKAKAQTVNGAKHVE